MEIGDILRKTKLGLIDGEGRVTVSEFSLKSDDEKVIISMPPEEVRVKATSSFRTFNIVEKGEIKLPKGEQLTAISWRGILPGAGMLLYPIAFKEEWDRPKNIIDTINRWRTKGTKLKLLITQTPINLDVYVKSFDYTAKGGAGDYNYDIDLIAAKELKVLTAAEADAQRSEQENSFDLLARTALKPKIGMYISYLDTAWTAAQCLRGNGDRMTLLSDNGLVSPDVADIGTFIFN